MNDRPARERVRIVLYRDDGSDTALELDDIAPPADDEGLLWVDIDGAPADATDEACRRLGIPESARQQLVEADTTPLLRNHGEHLAIRAVAVESGDGDLHFDDTVLGIVSGRNVVVTVHDGPIEFLETIRKRDYGERGLGALDAESFVASLLDWQLDTYFEAVADFEREIERLEQAILENPPLQSTRELRRLRKAASGLRRSLAPHRRLFWGLARADFRPGGDAPARRFRRLDTHFERAMGAVENARELVLGSYELFSNQIALRTNNAMRVLTFATVVIGSLTVIAGALGMNFNAPFFDTGASGFWTAIAIMLAVMVGIVALGKYKRWF